MDKKELAAQLAKEITIEFIRKYSSRSKEFLECYREAFKTILTCLEGTDQKG